MGVDFYPCSRCGEVYCDCGDYTVCNEEAGGCGRDWCGDGCAESDGYIRCSCKLGKDIDVVGYAEEECENLPQNSTYCADAECEHFVEASCSYCRNEIFTDEEVLWYALDLLNKTKEDLITEMKNR